MIKVLVTHLGNDEQFPVLCRNIDEANELVVYLNDLEYLTATIAE